MYDLDADHLLEPVAGFGPVTVVALAACLVEKTFTHQRQFVTDLGRWVQ